jgi:Tfp pilus assembly protein FimT
MLFKLHQVRSHRQSAGFTLLEMVVIMGMIGVLSAIAAPGWRAFHNNQRLNAAQTSVFEAVQQARKEGMLKRIEYQVSFRETNNRVEWAVYPASDSVVGMTWNRLEEGIRLDSATTLYEKDNLYRMRFNDRGEANGQIGQVVLSLDSTSAKRCVVISTLLGHIRQGTFAEKTKTCQAN